jgi:hypothetical protein
MIKLIGCARRLPHLSGEEFDIYWRDNHGPLVRSFADVLRIKRYIQVSTLANPLLQERIRQSRGSMEAAFDGYAEIWWGSLEEMTAARETPQGLAAIRSLLEDERRFVDLSRSQFWFGTERRII